MKIIYDNVEDNIRIILGSRGTDVTIVCMKENVVKMAYYNCTHTPVFGFDAYDGRQIDNLVDKLINEMEVYNG